MTEKKTEIAKDANEPFPIDEGQLPQAAEHTVTIGFSRKITEPNGYGANTECSLFETFKFAEELTPTQVELLRASVLAKQKAQVFLELGLQAELTSDGVLMEIAKVFPGAKPAQRTAPAALTRAVPPPEDYDQEPEPFPQYEEEPQRSAPQRAPTMGPKEQDWDDFFKNPKDFFDDLDKDAPRIKRRGDREAPARWLNEAPQYVKDWAKEQGIRIPPPPQRGGGGGGGYSGGGRTGGGGGYRRN